MSENLNSNSEQNVTQKKQEDRNQEFMEEKNLYLNREIPKELKGRIMEATRQGKEKRKKTSKMKVIQKIGFGAVAALGLFIALPNLNGDIAYAMAQTPVIGTFAKAVTFREYRYDSERYQADVNVPQLVTNDGNDTEDIQRINLEIDAVTEDAIAQFKENSQMEEGYEDLVINHETVTDNEDYLTVKLMVYIGAGSGSETDYYYTVSKITGKQVHLADLFARDSDYITALTNNIKAQMHEQMDKDEMVTYFVDSEDMTAFDFVELDENADFYFDEAGQLVICFDEYEVAPGFMGSVQFTIPGNVTDSLLK